jgi:hypothetical protein
VIGQGYTEIIKEYSPRLHVEVAPALRFQGVWKERKRFPDPSKFTVLIALDGEKIEYDIACLHQVFSCLTFLKEGNWCFWIKPHPTIPEEKIMKTLKSHWMERCEFVRGAFDELVEEANILLSNGMTNVCLEAIMKGVPVIILGKTNGPTFIPFPDSTPHDLWRLCYTVDDIVSTLQFFYKQGVDVNRQNLLLGEKLRSQYITPVTKEGIKRFLRLT